MPIKDAKTAVKDRPVLFLHEPSDLAPRIMPESTLVCNVCNAALSPDRARVRCQICPNYDCCADCHVTESVSGTHLVNHYFVVYRHGRQVLPVVKEQGAVHSSDVVRPVVPKSTTLTDTESKGPKDAHKAHSDDTLPAATTNNNPGPRLDTAASEAYWGKILTPTKTPSPIFSRLTKAILAHFDATSRGTLEPNELCALLSAAGYTAEQFPPLGISTESASPTELHQLDSWLVNWMQSFPLDHNLTTRQFPPPPPIEPVNGRIRMRDQFLHALMYPEPPVVPDGQPLLTPLGLEQYFLHQLLHDPEGLCVRMNQLLEGLPRVFDPETGNLFEAQVIPRSCFPPGADPEAEKEKREMDLRAEHDAQMAIMRDVETERQRIEEEQEYQAMLHQAQHNADMAVLQGLRNVSGGWWVDEDGNRQYQQGFIR